MAEQQNQKENNSPASSTAGSSIAFEYKAPIMKLSDYRSGEKGISIHDSYGISEARADELYLQMKKALDNPIHECAVAETAILAIRDIQVNSINELLWMLEVIVGSAYRHIIEEHIQPMASMSEIFKGIIQGAKGANPFESIMNAGSPSKKDDLPN